MTTMTITIERSPRTLQFGDTALQVEELSVRLPFARKPADLSELGGGDQCKVYVTETKELIAGYTLIQVRSREEALEWSRRYPNPAGEGITTEIEVRPLYELEDFAPSDAIERFKTIGLPE